MFKKQIAEGEKNVPVRLFFGVGGAAEEEDVDLVASSDTDAVPCAWDVTVAVVGLDVIVRANARDTLLLALAWDVLPLDARACKANPKAKVRAEITSDMV